MDVFQKIVIFPAESPYRVFIPPSIKTLGPINVSVVLCIMIFPGTGCPAKSHVGPMISILGFISLIPSHVSSLISTIEKNSI